MLPTVKIGELEITRLIVGSNPFVGKSHLDETTDSAMQNYYRDPERIFRTLRDCEDAGINTFQSRGSLPMMKVIADYNALGGNLHFLATSAKNDLTFEEELDAMMEYSPSAVCIHGELTDALYQSGRMDLIPHMLDRIRRKNVPCGICAHFPEALAYSETHGFCPDFYMASLYNLNKPDRSQDVDPTGERFEESDRAVMYRTIRTLSAPTIALKILGAGRHCASQSMVKAAFDEAYASIKPSDAVLVGMYDRDRAQPALDAKYAKDAMIREETFR